MPVHPVLRRLIERARQWLPLGRVHVILPGKASRERASPWLHGLSPDLQDRLVQVAEQASLPLEKLLPRLLRAAFRQLEKPDPLAEVWSLLTGRERDVARLMAQGLSNQEIAARLMISRNTVKTHARKVLARFGCRTRFELPEMPKPVRRPD